MMEFDMAAERRRANRVRSERIAAQSAKERNRERRLKARADMKKRGVVKIADGCCEACGWKPPMMPEGYEKRRSQILHLHHIVPISCGGKNTRKNLALLCPNCHAVCHAVWPVLRISATERDCLAPAEKPRFLAALKAIYEAGSADFFATSPRFDFNANA